MNPEVFMSSMPPASPLAAATPLAVAGSASLPVIGWDIGGAHVKAALVLDGRVREVRQCAAPLWQGLSHLDAAIDEIRAQWPLCDTARHAVTMTA